MTTDTREDEDCSCSKALRLSNGNLARACTLTVVLLAMAIRIALPVPAHAATSGSGNVVITVTPGQSVAVTVTPATLSLSEDVTSPGTGWMFDATNAAWMPNAWTHGTYFYGVSGSGNCLAITISTSLSNWGLTAYYGVSGGLTSGNTSLALAPSTAACGTPTSSQVLSANSGAQTTLQTSQNGSQTFYYYVAVQPTIATAANATITITFTAQ
ncbi:MAG TPA: hypothetical protein VKT83_08185 [bacterium]|nr:hypothetical protein [bacterium]